MSVRKNVLANYIGAGTSALAPILAMPWYISILGTKFWGLVSFIWVLQALLALVNAGLAQALIREISHLAIAKEVGQKRIAAILFGFERIYWGFSISAGLILAYFANNITTGWLRLGEIPVETGMMVIYAASAIFILQFPASLYRSVLFGSGHQIKQSVIISTATVLRHLGGVALLSIHGSIETYLVWNVITAGMETLVTAIISWRSLHVKRATLQWDQAEMRKVFLLTIGLSVSVFLGILTLQIDKIVLSWSLPIEQFGYYAIASAVSIGMLQAFTPIISAVLPKLVALQDQPKILKQFNLKLVRMMFVIVGVVAVIFSLAGESLLNLWLRDARVVAIVYPVLTVLLVGTGLNAIYSVGYINWVAAGASKKILIVNASALILSIMFLPFLVVKYQLIGAAFGWVSINLIGLLLSLDWIASGSKVAN